MPSSTSTQAHPPPLPLPPPSSSDAEACATLFRGLVFYVAREVPREPLLLVLRSFGADAVTWEGPGAPLRRGDPSITHEIVDRPPPPPSSSDSSSSSPSPLPPRSFVVPQWAFDSANFRVRADERRYSPGARPPPHLSPFASAADDGGYVPAYAGELRALREALRTASSLKGGKRSGGGGAEGGGEDSLAEFEAAAAAVAERAAGGGAGGGATTTAVASDGGGGGALNAIDADEAAAAAAHAEGIAKELGLSSSSSPWAAKKPASATAAAEEEVAAPATSADVARAADADRMRASMLPRKKRHLYESVRRAQDAKRARGEALAERAKEAASKKE